MSWCSTRPANDGTSSPSRCSIRVSSRRSDGKRVTPKQVSAEVIMHRSEASSVWASSRATTNGSGSTSRGSETMLVSSGLHSKRKER